MENLSPVQQAIVDEGGSQCGFCTPGFVVSLTGFLIQDSGLRNLEGFVNLAIEAMDGNICRCTGYKSLERAADKMANMAAQRNGEEPIKWLVQNEYLPAYFLKIREQLKSLSEAYNLGGNLKLPPKFSTNGGGKLIGGGTDLIVQKPEEILASPLENIFDRQDMRTIFEENGDVHIGGAATASDIFDSPVLKRIFPQLDN
ncbi:MAG: 2Fe-2S iron-sulfur cluster-binding protein, partial [Bacteroidota bacterium]